MELSKNSKVARAFSLAWCLPLVILTAACTNGGGGSQSKVTLALPDFSHYQPASKRSSLKSEGAAATWEISRVMINISAPDIPVPIFKYWDKSRFPGASAPASMELEVSRGKSRLIQVLVVAKDTSSTGSSDQLFYKDGLWDLLLERQPVDLTLEPINTATGEGAIAGRYLLADGTGPTGKIDMYFVPPGSSRPEMIVSQTEIHGGWFSFFALKGVTFRYKLSGTSLLGDFAADNLQWISGGPETMAITIPASYHQEGGSVYKYQPPMELQLGFFGPGAAGKVACFDNSTGKLMSRLFTTAAATTPIPWAGPVAPSASQGGVIRGGQGAASAVCSGTEYQNYVRFDETIAQGNSQALAIRGPFQPKYTSNGYPMYLQAGLSGNGINLSWKYLPGTTGPGRVSGVGIFARVASSAAAGGGRRDYEQDDGFLCNNLTDTNVLQNPFTFIKNVDASLETVTLTPTDIPFTATAISDFSSGKLNFVACPKKDGSADYYNAGIDYNTNGGSGNWSSIKLTGPQSITAGTCFSYALSYYQNGNLSIPAAGVSASLQSPSGGAFYADGACTSSITSMALTGPTTAVYYKNTGTSSTYDLSIQTTNGSSTALTIALGSVGTAPDHIQFKAGHSANANFVQGGCYSVDIGLSATNFTNNAARTVNVTDTSATHGTLYSDEKCLNHLAANQVAFSATEFYKTVFYMPSASNVGAISLTTTDSYTVINPLSITLAAPAITSIKLTQAGGSWTSGSLWFAPGQCMGMGVLTFASNGAPSSVTSTSAAVYTSGTVSLSSDVQCLTGSSSVTAAVFPNSPPSLGSAYQLVYGKMPTTATSATIGASLASPPASANLTFYRQPDDLNALINLPVSYTFLEGFCTPVSLQARWGGTPANTPTQLDFKVSLPANFGLYSDPSCSTSFSPNPSVGQGNTSAVSAYIMSATGATGGLLSMGVLGASTTPYAATINSTPPPGFKIYHSPSGTINVSDCVAIMPGLVSGASQLVNPVDVLISVVAGSNLQTNYNGGYFYNSASCGSLAADAVDSSPSSGVIMTIPAGTGGGQSATATRWVKFKSSALSGTSPQISLTVPQAPSISAVTDTPSSCSSTYCTWP